MTNRHNTLPTLERILYDDRFGADTKYGLGVEQIFMNGDVAKATVINILSDPAREFVGVDIDDFISNVLNFTTPEDIIATMTTIYDTFSIVDVNYIFFQLLHDAFADKQQFSEFMKTSWVALQISQNVNIPRSPADKNLNLRPGGGSFIAPALTPTVTPSVTPTGTPDATLTPSPSPTVSPTITITPSLTPTLSGTPLITPTNTVTASITPTVTAAVSVTPTTSVTPTYTVTPTVSVTPTGTPPVTLTVTPAITVTVTTTATTTPSVTASLTPTNTATPSITPTYTVTPSITPTLTASVTGTPTPTPMATLTITPTFTSTPDITPSSTMPSTPDATVTMTATPTATPTYTATPNVTATAAVTPTPTPSTSASGVVTLPSTTTYSDTAAGSAYVQLHFENDGQFGISNTTSGGTISYVTGQWWSGGVIPNIGDEYEIEVDLTSTDTGVAYFGPIDGVYKPLSSNKIARWEFTGNASDIRTSTATISIRRISTGVIEDTFNATITINLT